MKAVVVGGGIAGLQAARKLSLAGHRVTLLEATDRLGGLIRLESIPGQATGVDVGAESFSVARPETLSLIQELELDHLIAIPNQDGAQLYLPTGKVQIPKGILGIPGNLAGPAEALGLTESQLELARRLDSRPWQLEHPGTVEEIVLNRLGPAVLQNLVAPVLAGVHSSRPDSVLLDSVAPGLFATAAKSGSLTAAVSEMRAKAAKPGAMVRSLVGGMHTLVAAMSAQLEELGVDVRLGSPVSDLDVLRQAFGSDLAVLATPPAASSHLLRDRLGLASPLSQIKALDTTVVLLLVKDEALNGFPNGTGILVAEQSPGVVAKASTHSNAKWSWLNELLPKDHHLIRLSYGRDGQTPGLGTELISKALSDLQVLYGLSSPRLIWSHIQLWPQSMIQPRPGHQQLQEQIRRELGDRNDLILVGSGLGGNGITGILANTNQQLERVGV